MGTFPVKILNNDAHLNTSLQGLAQGHFLQGSKKWSDPNIPVIPVSEIYVKKKTKKTAPFKVKALLSPPTSGSRAPAF